MGDSHFPLCLYSNTFTKTLSNNPPAEVKYLLTVDGTFSYFWGEGGSHGELFVLSQELTVRLHRRLGTLTAGEDDILTALCGPP